MDTVFLTNLWKESSCNSYSFFHLVYVKQVWMFLELWQMGQLFKLALYSEPSLISLILWNMTIYENQNDLLSKKKKRKAIGHPA